MTCDSGVEVGTGEETSSPVSSSSGMAKEPEELHFRNNVEVKAINADNVNEDGAADNEIDKLIEDKLVPVEKSVPEPEIVAGVPGNINDYNGTMDVNTVEVASNPVVGVPTSTNKPNTHREGTLDSLRLLLRSCRLNSGSSKNTKLPEESPHNINGLEKPLNLSDQTPSSKAAPTPTLESHPEVLKDGTSFGGTCDFLTSINFATLNLPNPIKRKERMVGEVLKSEHSFHETKKDEPMIQTEENDIRILSPEPCSQPIIIDLELSPDPAEVDYRETSESKTEINDSVNNEVTSNSSKISDSPRLSTESVSSSTAAVDGRRSKGRKSKSDGKSSKGRDTEEEASTNPSPSPVSTPTQFLHLSSIALKFLSPPQSASVINSKPSCRNKEDSEPKKVKITSHPKPTVASIFVKASATSRKPVIIPDVLKKPQNCIVKVYRCDYMMEQYSQFKFKPKADKTDNQKLLGALEKLKMEMKKRWEQRKQVENMVQTRFQHKKRPIIYGNPEDVPTIQTVSHAVRIAMLGKKCQFCPKLLKTHRHLQKHRRKFHFRQRRFSCDVCKKSFFTQKQVNNHVRIHTGDKPFKCSICMSTFTFQQHLALHSRIHAEKIDEEDTGPLGKSLQSRQFEISSTPFSYKCHRCDKSFSTYIQKTRHIKNFHLLAKRQRYRCALCGSCCSSIRLLKLHYLDAHGKTGQTQRFTS